MNYFHAFWNEYTQLKKEYEHMMYIRKLYIDILQFNSEGTKNEMQWLDKQISRHMLKHKKLVNKINDLISKFKKYLSDNSISWNEETDYASDFYDALHGVIYNTDSDTETDYTETCYKCSYSQKDLCEFPKPDFL